MPHSLLDDMERIASAATLLRSAGVISIRWGDAELTLAPSAPETGSTATRESDAERQYRQKMEALDDEFAHVGGVPGDVADALLGPKPKRRGVV